jgi:hypothetical protein
MRRDMAPEAENLIDLRGASKFMGCTTRDS